jgi:acylglycerol lipase
MRFASCLFLLFALAACAPRFHPGGERLASPELNGQSFMTADQVRLPLRVWPSTIKPAGGIIIALHGFNDYSHAFDQPANWWADSGVTVYAYDQRGFGEAPHAGEWSSAETMADDLNDAILATRRRHPDLPIFLLGSSMGAAVILTALGNRPAALHTNIDGVILVGPAVWGPSTMSPLYRILLWLAAHTMPTSQLKGKGLRIQASDNIPMLRALGRDPLVIKSTRIDTLYGLVQLMGAALEGASGLEHPALVLGAANDQLIPGHAHEKLLGILRNQRTEVIYPDGFHMLLRDLRAKAVWRDILSWIENKNAALPSGLGRKTNPTRPNPIVYQ